MKQKVEKIIRNKKIVIALMECLAVIGCIIAMFVLMMPKDRVLETTYSYSKVEGVTRYKIVDNYIARVRPLTTYEAFKEIAENTLNNVSDDVQYTVKVYQDEEKTEEITEGYIASGMIAEAITESEEVSYSISVIGDMTKDGDMNVTELTRTIKGVIGLSDWKFTEEEKLAADISGDGNINVVDIELCINYIVFGELNVVEKDDTEEEDKEEIYTVAFKNDDGTVISEKTYKKGEKIEIPENPTKEDNTYTYEFTGWTPGIEEDVTKDAVYTATYKRKYKQYTVVFKNYDGTTIDTSIYHYGDKLEIPASPTKPADNTYTYEFAGWDPEIEENVTKNVEYIATYRENKINYTIIFYSDDGITESTRINNHTYGDEIKYPEAPVKESTEEYRYVFKEWEEIGTEKVTDTERIIKIKAQYEKEYFVAKIEKKENMEESSYVTLSEAIENAGTEQRTIKMIKDVQESVTVNQEQNITLDLNGKTITGVEANTINNQGNLIIIDKTEQKEGKIINENGVGIKNEGSLTINNSTVQATECGIENQSKGIIILGQKDESVDSQLPHIKSDSIAIKNSQEAIFNFYDGRLGGKTTIDGTITEREVSTRIITNAIEDKKECYLEKATNGDKFQSTDANGITWNYTFYEGQATNVYYESGELPEELTIPDTLDGCPVVSLCNSSVEGSIFTNAEAEDYISDRRVFDYFDYQSKVNVKVINIPDTVTIIGNNAFERCSNLETVNIPDDVTTIGDYAFYGCALKTINMKTNVTSIGKYAFSNCTNLTSISISKGITEIQEGTFRYCESLTILEIPEGVTSIGNLPFTGCSSLEDIYIDNLQSNITLDADWNHDSHMVHFSDCKHNIEFYIDPELEVQIEEVSNNCVEGKILCGNTYQFKILDANGEVVTDEKVLVKSQGQYIHSDVVRKEITANEEGIYIIDNIKRNKTIIIGQEKYKAIDENEITWNYTYKDGKAINVHYESGELKEILDIPSELDGYPVVSLYNSSEEKSIFAKAEEEYESLEESVEQNRLFRDQQYVSSLPIRTINIPNTVTEIGNNAFEICTNVESINMPEGVETIGDYAFFGCTSLESIKIPNNVTSVGKYAFGICSKLTNVTIPESVTSLGEEAFYCGINLTDIYVNSSIIIEKYQATDAHIHYSNCKHKIIINMYSNKNLQIQEISNNLIEGEMICGEEYRFKLVNARGEIVADEKVVLKSEGQFTYSEDIEEEIIANEEGIYTIDNINRNKIITIGEESYQTTDEYGITWNYKCRDGEAINVYYESGELKETVNIPAYLGECPVVCLYNSSEERSIFAKAEVEYENLERRVQENRSLSNPQHESRLLIKIINIPNTVKEIGNNAFEICTNVESINIPENVRTIGDYAFFGCTSLESIEIPNSVISIGSSAFGICSRLTNVTIPESVTTIGEQPFYSCRSLADIYINSDISIGSNWETEAYIHNRGCSHKIAITMRSNKNLQIQEISINLAEEEIVCRETYQFKLVNPEGEIVTDEEVIIKSQGQFTNWSDTEEQITPNEEGIYTIENINRNKTITIGKEKYQSTGENGITWNYTFENGKAINVHYESGELKETVNIPAYIDGFEVVSIYNSTLNGGGSIFAKYAPGAIDTTVKNVIIPEGVTNIGKAAFAGCRALTDVVIPRKTTTIGEQAFFQCYGLTNLYMHNGVLYIESEAFANCTGLTDFTMPESVISIGQHAFYNCRCLTEVTIPKSVTDISWGAFKDCTNLTDIYVNNIKSEVTYDWVFSSSGNVAYIHYSDCKHDMRINMYSKNNIKIEEVSNNFVDGKISCREAYQFKLVNEEGEVVTGEKVSVKSQGKFIHSGVVQEEIVPNAEGIYIIENINRNKIITIGQEKYQATVDGITWNYTYQNGKAVNVHYESGELTETVNIPSELDGYPVVSLYNSSEERSIFANAEEEYEDLKSRIRDNRLLGNPEHVSSLLIKTINIPDTVTEIGNNAFEICTSVESINIPDSVTNIGDYAFFGCTSLEKIEIPNKVTSVGKYAFGICSKLTNITIPESVTTIGEQAFYSCVNLADIYVNGNISIEYNDDTHAYVHYSDCKHNVVFNIRSNKNLQIQEISNNTTGGKISCGQTYQFKLVNPNGEIVTDEQVIVESQAQFTNWSNTEEQIMPNEEGIYTIENIKRNKIITIGEEVYQATVDGITWNYTYQDGKATDVHYESGNLSEEVTIPDTLDGYQVINLYNVNNENIFAKSNSANELVKKVIISEGVTRIDNYAFSGCRKLTEITIPNSVTRIGYGAFSFCGGLTNINIPDSVTNIEDSAFSGCTGLTNITIPDSVTHIGYDAFDDTAWYNNQPDGVVCAGKIAYKYKGTMPYDARVEIQEGVTIIGEGLFEGCSELTEVVIPDSVTTIQGNAFWRCTRLMNVVIPDSVTDIGYSAFKGCTVLEEVVMSNNLTFIGDYAFDNTPWYKNLPDGVIYFGKIAYEYRGEMPADTIIQIKDGTTEIASGLFRSQTNLIEVDIPDSVKVIGDRAFQGCSNLSIVTMSKNVTNIGEEAFAECTSLSSIVIWKDVDQMRRRTFAGWKDDQTVNIELGEVPEGWDEEWNKDCDAKIVYAYTGE